MLKPYTYFLFVLLFTSGIVSGQKKDTVKIALKRSNILIVSESDERNEWDFENDLNEKKEDKKESASLINIGLSLFSNTHEPWVTQYNNRIPYEPIKSNNLGYTSYKTLLPLLNGYGAIYGGLGIQSHNINLGRNILSSNNNLAFSIDSLFNPSKNKLRCTYIQVPMLIGLQPLLNKKPRFQIQFGTSFSYKIKSLLITKEFEGKNWEKTKIKGDFMLNQYYFNYHLNIIFKKFGLFSQFAAASMFSDNNRDYLFSTGIVISTFK